MPGLQFGLDALAWIVALPVAAAARFDFFVKNVNRTGLLALVAVAVVVQGLAGLMFGLYRRRFHYASFDELRPLVGSIVTTAAVLFGITQFGNGSWLPRSAPLIGACVALVVAAAIRYAVRFVEERHMRPDESSKPVIVWGAGEAGRQVIRSMLRTSSSSMLPVAMIDDDPRMSRFSVSGVQVEGGSADLQSVATAHQATTVLIAIPSVSSDVLRPMVDHAKACGLEVLLLPPVDAISGLVSVNDARPATVEDLLGRHQTEIDLNKISDLLRGRRVLVTGAGGSIGSELSRQIAAFEPASLVLLDRDESGLHNTQLAVTGRALLDDGSLELVDLRDRSRVFEAFERHRPEVVFHAAALKHLTLLELNPSEAWKTNVVGSRHVLDAAEAVGAERFVNVSTDKAADPISVLGSTKRLAERMTSSTAARCGLPYVSVRFGNVLGSRGSFLGVFREQIENGGPLTVTHPDVRRYFMTIAEAVRLTLHAAAIGNPGEVLVLDMGQSVRIEDVALQLCADAGRTVPIEYTGLRPGEKLDEVLLGQTERDRRPNHPLISQVRVPPLSFDEIVDFCRMDDRLVITPKVLRAAGAFGVGADRASSVTITDDADA